MPIGAFPDHFRAVRYRRSYRLHGLRVRVVSDSRALLARTEPLLEHLGLLPSAPAPDAPAVALALSTRPGAPAPPREAREIAAQDGIRACREGRWIYLSADDHVLRLDPSSGRGEGFVPAPPARVRKDLLLYGLLLLLRGRELYGLHASGVSREGRGYLFVAPSGSGKSTQVYGLVRQGWGYLGDDAVLLRPETDHVQALPLRRDLCLDPDLRGCFPEVVSMGEEGPFAGKGKRCLDMRALHPDRLVERCVPRVLVFPEIVGGPRSRLARLDPPLALVRLIAQSAVVALDPERLPRHLEVLRRLVDQARAYSLLAGADLRAEPERLAELLSVA